MLPTQDLALLLLGKTDRQAIETLLRPGDSRQPEQG
jgi:hypothetical protein